jgi:hypothetical protein
VGGKSKPHSCAREADPAFPAPRESPRPSQCVAIDSRFKRQVEEVDRRGAAAHLLLVVTKFSAVVALQGVATTYHDEVYTKHHVVRLALSSPCPSAQVLTTLIARWSSLG